MEYLVKISEKARILELKRRHLKITVLTSNTPYPSRNIRRICACTSLKTTKEQDPIRHIQRRPIRRIQVMKIKYSGRYQTWSLLQETPDTPNYGVLVKISKKARILELKRRNMKITVLTTNTPYSSRKIQRICACTSLKTTKETRSIHCIQRILYAVFKLLNVKILEDIKRGPYSKKPPTRRIKAF
ncbi:hypothetical protein Tco_1542063 [Tanacetum coccineum]